MLKCGKEKEKNIKKSNDYMITGYEKCEKNDLIVPFGVEKCQKGCFLLELYII